MKKLAVKSGTDLSRLVGREPFEKLGKALALLPSRMYVAVEEVWDARLSRSNCGMARRGLSCVGLSLVPFGEAPEYGAGASFGWVYAVARRKA